MIEDKQLTLSLSCQLENNLKELFTSFIFLSANKYYLMCYFFLYYVKFMLRMSCCHYEQDDNHDQMTLLINTKGAYEELLQDPLPTLNVHGKLNSTTLV